MAIFLSDRKISSTPPPTYNIIRTGIVDFCKSTEEFFDEYFRAAVRVNISMTHNGYVVVSPHGVAQLWRDILVWVNGRGVIEINIVTDKDAILVDISWQGTDMLDDNIQNKLASIADLSNFEISYEVRDDVNVVHAKLPSEQSEFLTIYARSPRSMRTAMIFTFFYEF